MMDESTLEWLKKLEGRVADLEREEHAMAQNHGWINGAWRKDPLPFGVSGVVSESLSSLSLPAGTSTINGSVVPAGEYWVITQLMMRYVGTITNVSLFPIALIAGVESGQQEELPVISGRRYGRSGWWVLWPGDNMVLYVIGATLNDNAYFEYGGFRVDIDQ